ncbi:PREDICTED: ras-related protein RABG3a-like [Dinoponera quadriceps]|uniref:Ras-related protein RABG3a-like n=1 Tax=Dinoponera quadriceps TaxID=609295 RepID=A0A6P3XUM3_DINQU|nr:PREDICTED: ras-related protein RABG3a-like [Dinoponera quadriceps]
MVNVHTQVTLTHQDYPPLVETLEEDKMDVKPRRRATLGSQLSGTDTLSIHINNKLYKLNLFDTVAVEEFVVSPSDFQNLEYWIRKFKKKADITNADTFPFIVVGNKQDISESDRLISRKETDDWCRENNLWHLETSTKENKHRPNICGRDGHVRASTS